MGSFNTHLLGEKLGQKLSNFKYVYFTLVIYLILCLLTFIWLAFTFSPYYNQAQLITYAVMTGADPFSFKNEIGSNEVV